MATKPRPQRKPKPRGPVAPKPRRPPTTARTFAEIGRHFGVSESTVSYWRRQGAPIVPGQPNDLAKITTWKTAWEATRQRPSSGGGNLDKLNEAHLAARAKERIARAKIAEIQAAQLERSVIALADAQQEFAAMIAAIQQALRAVPIVVRERLGLDEDQAATVEAEIEHALRVAAGNPFDARD